MTHILSKEKDFAFIHIPKNGGSTIRDQFSSFDDCGQKFFANDKFHPELGKVAYGHLPLWVIAKYYPQEFAQIRKMWACAITRDPIIRFRSAMAQRARQYVGCPIEEMSVEQRAQEIGRIMRHLEQNRRLPSDEFCHFTRQYDFIFFEGEQVVKNVYPIEQIDTLVAELGVKADVKIFGDAQNKTEYTRLGWLGEAGRFAWSVAKPLLPASFEGFIRSKLRSIVVSSGTETDKFGLMDDRLISFIRDFYAKDFELNATASKAITAAFKPQQHYTQPA